MAGDEEKAWLHKGNRETDTFAKLGARTHMPTKEVVAAAKVELSRRKEIVSWIALAHTAWKPRPLAPRERRPRRTRAKYCNITASEGGHSLDWHPLGLRCKICARTATRAKSIANIRREACRGPLAVDLPKGAFEEHTVWVSQPEDPDANHLPVFGAAVVAPGRRTGEKG